MNNSSGLPKRFHFLDTHLAFALMFGGIWFLSSFFLVVLPKLNPNHGEGGTLVAFPLGFTIFLDSLFPLHLRVGLPFIVLETVIGFVLGWYVHVLLQKRSWIAWLLPALMLLNSVGFFVVLNLIIFD
jgi:hypothetical protein